MSQPRTVRVTIYGRVYRLVGPDPERLLEMARRVDETMRRFSERMHGVDNYQLVVLTALHLADELATVRDDFEAYRDRVDSTSTRMLAALVALDGSPPEPAGAGEPDSGTSRENDSYIGSD